MKEWRRSKSDAPRSLGVPGAAHSRNASLESLSMAWDQAYDARPFQPPVKRRRYCASKAWYAEWPSLVVSANQDVAELPEAAHFAANQAVAGGADVSGRDRVVRSQRPLQRQIPLRGGGQAQVGQKRVAEFGRTKADRR